MMKKKTLIRIVLLVAGLVLLSMPIAVALAQQECTAVWSQAESVIADNCNEYRTENTLCYAHSPLSTAPTFDWFQSEGNFGPITTELEEVQAYSDNSIGGFSWLKIVTETNLPEYNFGQTVTLIAFGNTRLKQIENGTTAHTLDENDVGYAQIKLGSTTFGGSYIRVIPDPLFQTECYSGVCSDKNNLLHFVEEGIMMGVIGKNFSGDSLLVHDDHATGWMTASQQYIEAPGQDLPTFMASLKVFDDRIIANMLDDPNPSYPSIARSFQFENLASTPSSLCKNENRPPGGLLIVNPSHQHVAFSINSISIVLASSVFVYQPFGSTSNVMDVFVLQGEATIDNTLTAVAGQVVRVGQGPIQFLQTDGNGNWCQARYELAAAVYQPFINGVPVGVPVERLNYCNYMPAGGYPLGMPSIDVR